MRQMGLVVGITGGILRKLQTPLTGSTRTTGSAEYCPRPAGAGPRLTPGRATSPVARKAATDDVSPHIASLSACSDRPQPRPGARTRAGADLDGRWPPPPQRLPDAV